MEASAISVSMCMGDVTGLVRSGERGHPDVNVVLALEIAVMFTRMRDDASCT